MIIVAENVICFLFLGELSFVQILKALGVGQDQFEAM